MTAKILLVEDNPITRKMMHFALTASGYHVLEAADGRGALERMDERPDLVLLDLLLPDTDGFELVHHVRAAAQRYGAVPVLACSGVSSAASDSRLAASGFDDVISKPVEPNKLIEIVRAYLPNRRAIEQWGRGKTAVLADDDEVQLKLMHHRLEEVGFKVLACANGEAALALARRPGVDCIVSDVMMPKLDGFGLARLLRRDPALKHLPLILATSTYVEPLDRQLARRIGADDLILRSPELTEVLDALRTRLSENGAEHTAELESDGERAAVDEERARRIANQLEKQVERNAKLLRRNATLAAELAVVNGIAAALATGTDIEAAIHTALTACLDAGGVSQGALYVFEGESTRVRVFGPVDQGRGLRDFFGRLSSLRELVDERRPVFLSAVAERLDVPEEHMRTMLIPLVNAGDALGALVLAEDADDAEDFGGRLAFAEAVGNQLALALAVAKSFEMRRRAEQIALEQSSTLASIFTAASDGIVTADAQGHVIQWNEAATRILGRPPLTDAPPIWTGATRAHRPDGGQLEGPTPIKRALDGEAVDNVEIVLSKPGDESTWATVSARPLRDSAGGISGAVAILRDVTAEKRAQGQLMLSDRMASVGMLAAGVAHEINNPLAALMTNLQFAVESRDDTERDESLRDAVESAQRVRDIVKDLKIFSRAEEDKRGFVDIERVLDSSARMAWTEIRHKARLELSYGAVPRVYANDSRLGQVFLNLLVNAAQALPDGHADKNRIRIRTRVERGGSVVAEVEDTGPGIPDHVLGRLFTPFFTTKPAGLGTGLGLSICRRIVESYGGTITVTTSIGRGTTFRVELPVADDLSDTSVLASGVSPERGDRNHTRTRLLVVDDEEMAGRALKRALGRDHDVVLTTEGQAALARLAAGEVFDIILCDLMMPVMSGMEFYDDVARLYPDALEHIVFMTASAFTPAARAFLDRVTNDRLEKPFETAALIEVMKKHLLIAAQRKDPQ